MLTELLLNIFFSLFNGLISTLPKVEALIPLDFLSTLEETIQASAYFLPITALLPIMIINTSLEAFNFLWKIILRIKSFIPTMGD